MNACIDMQECMFADFELSLSAVTGFCRLLSSCVEESDCLGTSVVTFKKIMKPSFNSPQWMMTCPTPAVLTTACMTEELYDAAFQSVVDLFGMLDKTCNEFQCHEADLAGCLLRMAGHDFMDYNGTGDGKGGADACTDMDDGDNAGLPECLFRGEFDGKVSLNDAYALFCDKISLADFIVLAAEAVMAHFAVGETKELLAAGFKSNFRYGRTTAFEGCQFSVGVLPNPANSCDAVDDVFNNNMGLNWTLSAALMGVHTLGRAEVKNSGYDGWWTTPEKARRFGHGYFVNIYAAGWCHEMNVNSCPDEAEAEGDCVKKHQWQRCDVKRAEKGQAHEMMLNTDLCLAYMDQSGGDGSLKAGEDNCCAWVHTNVAPDSTVNTGDFDVTGIIAANDNFFCNLECNEIDPDTGVLYNCGKDNNAQSRKELEACCAFADGAPDCRSTGLAASRGPGGPAEEDVRRFAEDELYWADMFLIAWTKAIENGFEGSLKALGNCQ